MLTPAHAALAKAAGIAVRPSTPLQGGDISPVIKMGPWVLKAQSDDHPPQLSMSEANGLSRLRAAGCLTPEVHFADELGIVLKFYPAAQATSSDYAAFGVQLAQLHLACLLYTSPSPRD